MVGSVHLSEEQLDLNPCNHVGAYDGHYYRGAKMDFADDGYGYMELWYIFLVIL